MMAVKESLVSAPAESQYVDEKGSDGGLVLINSEPANDIAPKEEREFVCLALFWCPLGF